jgi:hypothetical protein
MLRYNIKNMMMNGKMDKFIRLSSMQSGNFNSINNMITFNLPSDGSYDFSSSYVEIQTQVTQAAQTAANAAGTSDVIFCPQLTWYDTALARGDVVAFLQERRSASRLRGPALINVA